MKNLNTPKKVGEFLTMIDGLSKEEVDKKQSERFKRIFGESYSKSYFFDNELNNFYNTIKQAKKMDGYIARALNQIIQKGLKNGWSFYSNNPKNAKIIEKKFTELIYDSNMNVRIFLRDVLKNCVSYANAFVLKGYTQKGQKKVLSSLTVLPSCGWEALQTKGPFVTEWEFRPSNGSAKTYTNKDIVHFFANKDTDEIFGTPFVASVLEDAQLLRDLEGVVLEQYFSSSQKRTVFFIGTPTSPGTPTEIKNLKETLNALDTNSDLILSSRIKFEILETKYEEPTTLLNNFKERIFAGLLMSSSSMGISGAGRQDADTQSTKELIVVEDFQDAVEDILNNTIIRELCYEAFGEYSFDNSVEFCFNENFDELERVGNYHLNLFNSNAIDHDELRKKIKFPSASFREEKSFDQRKLRVSEEEAKIQKKYNVKTTTTAPKTGTTQSKATPSNQHATKTSSKQSVKN